MLEVGVPHLALFLSEVSKGFGTLLQVAELKLIAVSITGASSVCRSDEEH